MQKRIEKKGYEQIIQQKAKPFPHIGKEAGKVGTRVVEDACPAIALAVSSYNATKGTTSFIFGGAQDYANHSSYDFFRESLIRASQNKVGDASVVSGYYNNLAEGERMKAQFFVEKEANYKVTNTTKRIYNSLENADYNNTEWINKHNTEMIDTARNALNLRGNYDYSNYGQSLNEYIESNLTASGGFIGSAHKVNEVLNKTLEERANALSGGLENASAYELGKRLKGVKAGKESMTTEQAQNLQQLTKIRKTQLANTSKNTVRMMTDIYDGERYLSEHLEYVPFSVAVKDALTDKEYKTYEQLRAIAEKDKNTSVSSSVGAFLQKNAGKDVENTIKKINKLAEEKYHNVYTEIEAKAIITLDKTNANNQGSLYARLTSAVEDDSLSEQEREFLRVAKKIQFNRAKMSVGEAIAIRNKRLVDVYALLNDDRNSGLLNAAELKIINELNTISTSTGLANGETELLILLNTENQAYLGKEITDFEEIVRQNVLSQQAKLKENATQILKKYGSKVNDKTLSPEVLSAFLEDKRLSEAERMVINDYIKAQKDLSNEKLKYLIGRIATGEINVSGIVASGKFCGSELSADAKTALLALDTLASTDKIVAASENEILDKIGTKSHVTEIDLNDIRQVRKRIAEFSNALAKSGVSTNKSRSFGSLSLKQLQKVDTSTFSEQQKNAFDELKKLKQHEKVLSTVSSLKRAKRRFVTRQVENLFGSTGVVRGIKEVRRTLNMVKSALKVYKLTAKVVSPIMPKSFKIATKTLQKPQATLIDAKSNPSVDNAKMENKAISDAAKKNNEAENILAERQKREQSQKAINEAKKQAQYKSPNYKQQTKQAKEKEQMLKKKAGKQEDNFRMRVNNLADTTKARTEQSAVKKGAKTFAKIKFGWVLVIIIVVILFIALIVGVVASLGGSSSRENNKELAYITVVTDDGEEQNIVVFAKARLDEIEAKALSLDTVRQIIENKEYRYFAMPDGSCDRINADNIVINTENTSAYRFVNGEKIIVESDEIKKQVLSMAIVLTSANKTKHLLYYDNNDVKDVFLAYSEGLYSFLQTQDVSVYLLVDEPSNCKTVTYYCDDDAFYSIDRVVREAGEKVVAEEGERMPMCLVGSDLVPKTATGCAVIKYSDDGKSVQTLKDGTIITDAPAVQMGNLVDIINGLDDNCYVKQAFNISNLNDNPFAVTAKDGVRYKINPLISLPCYDEVRAKLLEITNENSARAFVNSLSFHIETDECNNQEVTYCEGCETLFHGSHMPQPCVCDDCEEEIIGYICNGHDREKVEFCSQFIRSSVDGTYYNHVEQTPCDNCESFVGENGVTYYNCLGHTVIEHYFHSESDTVSLCDDRTPVVAYNCKGYEVCNGHDVCLGHFVCGGHSFCAGHTAYCSKGSACSETTNIVSDSKIYSDEWVYNDTKNGRTIPVITFELDTFFTKEKSNGSYDRGWTDEVKDLVRQLTELDWEKDLGIVFDTK